MSRPALFVGFDSAWADNPKVPGALCALRYDGTGFAVAAAPQLVGFDAALRLIGDLHRADAPTLVALDQPTIVRNAAGSRPVDRLAASIIGWAGGGVQSANRGRLGLFDDDAPVWRFLGALGAADDPPLARCALAGLFVMEVFPALAVLSLGEQFFGRRLAPRYNPARPTFRLEHWRAVVAAAGAEAERLRCAPAAAWLAAVLDMPKPRKADQDRLDAVLCLLVAVRWRLSPPEGSMMIGDRETGSIVAPVSAAMRERLTARAQAVGVPAG